MGEPPMPRREVGRVRSVNPARREVRVTPRRGYERALAGRNEVEFAFRRRQEQDGRGGDS
jgi:hypothetical protein